MLHKPWPARPLRQDTEERSGQLPSIQAEGLGLQAGRGQGSHPEESNLYHLWPLSLHGPDRRSNPSLPPKLEKMSRFKSSESLPDVTHPTSTLTLKAPAGPSPPGALNIYHLHNCLEKEFLP